MIREEFGLMLHDIVDALTKRSDETYLDSILRAKKDYFARQIKWADNEHNSHDLKAGSLLDKYRMSQYILLNE